MKKENEFKPVPNPIEQILDENCVDNIILMDKDNKPIEFEQVALISLDDSDYYYAMLFPVTKIEGVKEDEEGETLFVLAIDTENSTYRQETDQDVIDKVIDAYEKLLQDSEGNK